MLRYSILPSICNKRLSALQQLLYQCCHGHEKYLIVGLNCTNLFRLSYYKILLYSYNNIIAFVPPYPLDELN